MIAAAHRAAALTGFAGIFPPSAPKPTHASLRPRWQELVNDPEAVTLVADAAGVVGYVCDAPRGRCAVRDAA